MRHRVLVVDDERPARAKVKRLLRADDRFERVGEASTGSEALRELERLRPNVVILDVQMPGLDGFEVLDALGPTPNLVVIFSTAHDEHALRAFDAHAVDYLLKPYDGERFRRALDKAHAQLVAKRYENGELAGLASRGVQRLVVKTDEGWVPLAFETILRISAAGKYVHVVTTEKRHLVRQSLRAIAARLDPTRFVRVHRSEIVNLAAVVRLDPWEHGDGILVLSDGATVVLTRTHRQSFLERFGPRGGGDSP
jgi:two-component system LytT family response regulator